MIMFRWVLLAIAAALLLVSLLTAFKAPAWSPWRLAVLAGEFGHRLALPTLLLVALAGWQRQWPAVVVGALAAALLLKPVAQAWRAGRALPEALAAGVGRTTLARPAFSCAAFFDRDPAPVAAETHAFAPGLALDFHRPAFRRDPARGDACVIVVHGGGWDSGDRTQFATFNHWLARRGYAVAAISYRLAPQHPWPAPRDDTLAAIAFLKSRAPELGLDATRLVLLGRSAGGQIALATAYTARDPAIRGAIGLYTPADLIFGYEHTHENDMLKSPALMRQYLGGTPQSARARYEHASPHHHVARHSPPTLLLHGENDALVWHRHSARLDARLAEEHVPHAFVSLPWATHAFDYHLHGPGGQLTTFAVEWFLAVVTRL